MIITTHHMTEMEKLAKVQLMTSLPGAKPIVLVGTASSEGSTNLAPFSSITHLGSSPPLIGMITRPDSVARHTLDNILSTEQWTLNHIHPRILESAHQCSAKYPEDESEFTATGLTEQFYEAEDFVAPSVKESIIKYGLTLEDIVDIKANGTKLIIGRVQFIDMPKELLLENGGIDLIKADSLCSTALDTYFQLSNPQTLPYARV